MRRWLLMLTAVALAVGLAIPAGAAPATTEMVSDFYTNALDADGNFRLVHCSQAHQTIAGDKVKENYTCAFISNAFWGDPVLPKKAMRWDYDSSDGLVDATIPGLEGPYRWFSDVEDILTGDMCWMYTNEWRMVITPSGNVNVTVVYDPPVWEGPDCP